MTIDKQREGLETLLEELEAGAAPDVAAPDFAPAGLAAAAGPLVDFPASDLLRARADLAALLGEATPLGAKRKARGEEEEEEETEDKEAGADDEEEEDADLDEDEDEDEDVDDDFDDDDEDED